MNSNIAAHRALLAQILQAHRHDNDIIDKFVFAIEETSSGQLVASEDELAELLRVYTRCAGRQCFIVLDGIDECLENDRLIQDLLKLKQDSEVMMLLFSRPTVAPLLWTVPTEQQLLVGRKTSRDIEIYLSRKLELLQKDGFLPANANAEELVGHLLTGADGMFLWARLMISYLKCSALTRFQRVEVIENVILPEGLEAMYDRIGELIGKGYQIERNLAKKIIVWLTFTERRLTTRELQNAIAASEQRNPSEDDTEDLEEFTRMVIMTCACLVETETMYSPVHNRMATFFRFIHLSASEYFSSGEGHLNSKFSTTPMEAHVEITGACLHFLTFELPAQPLGGTLGRSATKDSLSDVFPFCNYAALNWGTHLEATKFDVLRALQSEDFSSKDQFDLLLLSLAGFLSQSFVLMAWIEANYVYGKPPPFEPLRRWSSWSRSLKEFDPPQDLDVSRLCDDVEELVRYLPELHEYWGCKLIMAPGCLWEEVTAFTPCRLLPQTATTSVHSMVKDEPKSDYLSTQYMCKVSESTSDGLLVGILSIWPSRCAIRAVLPLFLISFLLLFLLVQCPCMRRGKSIFIPPCRPLYFLIHCNGFHFERLCPR